MRLNALLSAAVLFSLFATPARAEDSFRCPNGSILQLGDRVGEATIRCDAPTVKNKHVESTRVESEPPVTTSVDVEEWTYNPGPRQFIHTLIFRNGALAEVRRGEYGK